MNASVYFLLLRKDLYRFRFWGALLLVCTVLNRYLIPHLTGGDFGAALAYLTTGLPFFIVVAGGLTLGQEDRAIGDNAFWHTRPIPGLTLLLAKLSVLVLCIMIPAAAVDLIRGAQHDIHGYSLALIGIERACIFGVPALVALYLGATNSSLLRSIAVMLIIALTVILVLSFGTVFRLPSNPLNFVPFDVGDGDRFITGFIGLAILATVLLIALYRTRQSTRIAYWAALGTCVIVFALYCLPLRATKLFAPTSPSGFESIDQPTAETQLHIDSASPPHLKPLSRFVTGRTVQRVTLHLPISIEPPETILTQLSVRCTYTLPDGKTHPVRPGFYFSEHPNSLTTHSVEHTLGLPSRTPPHLELTDFANDRATFEKLIRFEGQTLTLDLTLSGQTNRILLDDRIPFEIGRNLARSGWLSQVDDIYHTSGERGLNAVMLRSCHQGFLSSLQNPEIGYQPWSDRTDFIVLVNRTTGARCVGIRTKYTRTSRGSETFRAHEQHVEFKDAYLPGTIDPEDKLPVDESWLGDSDLIFVRSTPVGRIQETLHFENIPIPSLATDR